jgi:hypothetical protein
VLLIYSLIDLIAEIGSEQKAADLQKKVLAKVGTITDVVATVGSYALKTPLLQQSAEELAKVRNFIQLLCAILLFLFP